MQSGTSMGVRTVTAPGGPGQDGQAAPVQQRADEAGLHRAFVAYGAELTGLARRVLGSHHLAEEAVQETFERAWKSRDRFDPEVGPLRAWLFSIERNLLVDMARSRGRRERLDQRAAGRTEHAADDVERAIVTWQVEEAIQHLTPGHRAVLVETYFRGRTSKEVAGDLGIAEGTVRSRLYHALRSVRSTLEKSGWEQ
jgi:RNA polymerase sigma-70 factor (ECF subfamily)